MSLPPARRVKWGARATYAGGVVLLAGLVLLAYSQGAGVLTLLAGAVVVFAGHKLSAWDESFEPPGQQRRVDEPVELDRWFYAVTSDDVEPVESVGDFVRLLGRLGGD